MVSSGFHSCVAATLVHESWSPDARGPQRQGNAVAWGFKRPLADGWEVILRAEWYPREAVEVSKWRRGMKEVVFVDARITYPAGDELARAVGMRYPPSVDRPVEVMFEAAGQEPGELQMRNQSDYARAARQIDAFASDAVIPWARANAALASWLAEYERAENAELAAWAVPVMLAAHGREEDARARLAVARGTPGLAADPEFLAFAERLESFLDTGQRPEVQLAEGAPFEEDRTAEDPIRKEFIEGFFRERAEESVGAQLRFLGRKLRSGIRTLREAGGDGHADTSWWAPVAVAADAEQLLDRAFEAAGPPVDHRVGLQVHLAGRGSAPEDAVEIRFDGTAVGVLRPAEIPTWGVIARLDGMHRARLTRKREEPRFLLEVDIGS